MSAEYGILSSRVRFALPMGMALPLPLEARLPGPRAYIVSDPCSDLYMYTAESSAVITTVWSVGALVLILILR
jgi:hypothetical protein